MRTLPPVRKKTVSCRVAICAKRDIARGFKVELIDACSLLLALLFCWSSSLAQNAVPVNVPTWRYDTTHVGANTQELALTPSNVNGASFGKLFSLAVDGYVYSQPLYVSGLTMPDGLVHNVLFVATQHDSLYAFDADTNGGANAQPLWHASMLAAAHGAAAGATTVSNSDIGSLDVVPEIGINGTPAINLATNTLYLVAKTKENGTYVQRLHAINIITGAEQPNSPVVISGAVAGTGNGSSGGQLAFSSLWQMNRGALDFYNGHVYIPFGSHGDNGPWHGWLMAYDGSTLAQTAALCFSANGFGNGVWGAGAGLPIDTGGAAGRIYLSTGNGTYSTYPPLTAGAGYGDSIVQVDLANGGLTPSDAFTPFNQAALSNGDADQGSGGVLMPPDQAGTYPHVLIQAGKEGRILVLNRDKMGGYLPGGSYNANALQDIAGQIGGLWSTPAYWNGNVYIWGSGDKAKQFGLSNGVMSTVPLSTSGVSSAFPGASFVVSSDGPLNGVAWAVKTDDYATNGSEILYAFNPTNLADVLYESDTNSRDDAGPATKFVVPVVTNGKVYLGAAYQVDVYGLLAGAPLTAAPVITPNGGNYAAAGQSVALSSATPSATIYYTLDGSLPTPASPVYTAPMVLQTDTVVRAIASASGYLQSAVSTASFNFGVQTAPVTFMPAAGTYNATQQVTLLDTDPAATIYYTLDGSTPTISSAVYTGPITVSATDTINAVALDPILLLSNPSTSAYVIQPSATLINYGSGFASAQGLTLNGSATNKNDSRLQLTTGAPAQAGSFFYNQPVNVQTFTTDFMFQLSSAAADGFTLTIQNVGPTALGGSGAALGYAIEAPSPGITSSVAVKFDIYSNAGEGGDSTGIYINGAMPTVPAVNLSNSGIVLSSGDSIHAHLTYDGTTLTMTLNDLVTGSTFTLSQVINIPATVGANTAYVGFTGATGGYTSSQKILSWTYASQPLSTPTAAPFFSPAAGSYQATQNVVVTSSTPGAVIHYTTDGTTPTVNSPVPTDAIVVGAGTTTIKAIALASGFSQSAVSSAAYVVTLAATPPPIFSPAAGTYTSPQMVSLTDSSAGAVMYYTTNGTTPTTASPVYASPIQVAATETISAIAVATGSQPSTVASALYTIQSGLAPTLSPAPGTYATTQSVVLADSTTGAVIYYTTNGTTPTTASPVYSAPIQVTATETISAIAVVSGAQSSPVATGLYTIQAVAPAPSFAPAAGTYTAAKTVTLLDSNASAVIHYTTDGSNPTAASPVYASPIQVAANETISAVAVVTGFSQSPVSTAAYVIAPPTKTPTLSPAAGTFTAPQTVTLADATSGAVVHYTLDGSTPTTASAIYVAPIQVAGTETISAMAVASGNSPSAVASGVYTIQTGGTSSPTINYGSGFAGVQGLTLNGSATNVSNLLELTTGGSFQAGSVFYTQPVNVQSFVMDFSFALASAKADGFTFTIQNVGPTALGGAGFDLGYGGQSPSPGISKSVAVKFDIYNNSGEGTDSTGVYTNGAVPTVPSVDMTSSGLQLSSGDQMQAHITYNGTTLTMVLTDTVTGKTFTLNQAVNIPQTVGANTAYVGFTGGTGGSSVIPKIRSWTYTVQPAATSTAAPVAVPAAGTFTTPQMVTLTSSTAGAVIYFTTDGSTPTIASTVYTAPLVIGGGTETVQAMAVAPGNAPSAVVSSVYTIQTGSTSLPTLNYSSGFAAAQGLTLNGSAINVNNQLELTTGGSFQAGSVFASQPVNVQSFVMDFSFALASAKADGFTFTIQNVGPTALGSAGFDLGYGGQSPSPGISKSVAVKFDIYNNSGEGTDSTGVYTNGAVPTVPSVDMTSSGVQLSSGDLMQAHITYNGTTLTMVLTDTVTGKTFTLNQAVNIPQTVGANTAYVGFTGGTGGSSVIPKILSWIYTVQPAATSTAAPVASPAAGTFTTPQKVVLTSSTPGAVIYFTTDGSTPTIASTVYTAPLVIGGGTETISAMAVASGNSPSAVASGVYTIQTGGTSSPTINYGSGFAGVQGLTLNGSATNVSNLLELTTGGSFQAGSVFYTQPVNVQSFVMDFSFALAGAKADGFTFTIQNVGPTALGGAGFDLGYGGQSPSPGISKSVAVKFDIYNNSGEGTDSTGVYTNGAVPTVPSVDMTSSGLQLSSGDQMQAHITYNGTTLTMVLTDTVTGKTFTLNQAVNIPQTVGANTAYVGFTAGTGSISVIPKILNWTYTSGSGAAARANMEAVASQSAVSDSKVTNAEAQASVFASRPGSTSKSTPDGKTPSIDAFAADSSPRASAPVSQTNAPVAHEPRLNPSPGALQKETQVRLTSNDPSGVIHYTVDGSQPNETSAIYHDPIVVAGTSLTVKAFTSKQGMRESAVVTGTYYIRH